ncbi:hypothetical protein TWF225_000954 [Orbilia oligospora]|nr:hypothetical protein TWF225_000954 [Orbilia oligospora]
MADQGKAGFRHLRLRGPDLLVDCATFQCNATVQSGRDLDVMYVRKLQDWSWIDQPTSHDQVSLGAWYSTSYSTICLASLRCWYPASDNPHSTIQYIPGLPGY